MERPRPDLTRLRPAGGKRSTKRDRILTVFLRQEGHVSAKKMAEAFQRQVIYGGTLDTILLEMDVVDEGTLVGTYARTGR